MTYTVVYSSDDETALCQRTIYRAAIFFMSLPAPGAFASLVPPGRRPDVRPALPQPASVADGSTSRCDGCS